MSGLDQPEDEHSCKESGCRRFTVRVDEFDLLSVMSCTLANESKLGLIEPMTIRLGEHVFRVGITKL